MHKVLYITDPSDPLVRKVKAVAENRLQIEIWPCSESTLEFADFDAVLIGDCSLTKPIDSTGPTGPKFLQLTRGHNRSVDVVSLNGEGITIAGSSPVLADQVAKHALSLAVAALSGDSSSATGSEQDVSDRLKNNSQLLNGKTLGIVGFGRTGQATANLATSLDMSVIYADVRTAQHGSTSVSKARRSTLDLLLSKSDIVSLHVQWGPTSNPLVSERELRLMQRDAVLVNTSDTRLVDTDDLLKALKAGKIRAALDIEEPDAALIADEPNAVMTRYSAARSEEADSKVAEFVVSNIESFLTDTEPQGLIEMIDFPKAGDPAFWSSRMSPRVT